MRKQEHNYEIREYKYGFKIIPRDETRQIVKAILNKNGFWKIEGKNKWNEIPLYNIYHLLESVVEDIYVTWTSPKGEFKDEVEKFRTLNWAKKVTRKTLAKKIQCIWKNKCNSLDPKVNELHKKLHSVSNGSGQWGRINYILENKKEYNHLINDMIKYPAARIAVLHSQHDSLWDNFSEWDGDWMKLYSYNGVKYSTLRKTLMNFPYGILYYYVLSLNGIKIPEPITTRIRMWVYTYLARNFNPRYQFRDTSEKLEQFIKVVMKSTDDDIKKAILHIWEYFPPLKGKDFRCYSSIIHSLNMIFDYPFEIGDWDIVGLAKRSEVHHHDLDMLERARRLEREKANQEMFESKTMLPPIPLPNDKNIKFLDTYKSVFEEGELMRHCIGQYAGRAVNGFCYLFHVDYNGEMASVEVTPFGYVNQSYGPHDSHNSASEYGKRVLGRWAKGLDKKKANIYNTIGIDHLNVEYAEIPF